jgi:hypothetical protein
LPRVNFVEPRRYAYPKPVGPRRLEAGEGFAAFSALHQVHFYEQIGNVDFGDRRHVSKLKEALPEQEASAWPEHFNCKKSRTVPGLSAALRGALQA